MRFYNRSGQEMVINAGTPYLLPPNTYIDLNTTDAVAFSANRSSAVIYHNGHFTHHEFQVTSVYTFPELPPNAAVVLEYYRYHQLFLKEEYFAVVPSVQGGNASLLSIGVADGAVIAQNVLQADRQYAAESKKWDRRFDKLQALSITMGGGLPLAVILFLCLRRYINGWLLVGILLFLLGALFIIGLLIMDATDSLFSKKESSSDGKQNNTLHYFEEAYIRNFIANTVTLKDKQ